MIRLALWLWLLAFGVAAANPVVVKSGEHEGFTRLVADFGTPVAWQMGRTDDGYALRISGTAPVYDLSAAFRLIGKGRLAAIWADPQSHELRLGIACACHAIPFEFRPGIVVIDLRDGPPPAGSSFELALDGQTAPALSDRPPPRPKPRPDGAAQGYDWQDQALADLQAGSAPSSEGLPAVDPALAPMRAELLRDLSAGAAEGVVDLALPESAGLAAADAGADAESLQSTLNGLPGVSASAGLPEHAGLSASGADCIPAEKLDFAAWIDARPLAEQFAAAHAGLVGEFDLPDPAALTRAVRFRLAAGFGAEARQLLHAFPAPLPDRALLIDLSYLVDGDLPPPGGALAGLAACDTPAALWAFLADPGLRPGDAINQEAAIRAFSALPADLRRYVAPVLARRFTEIGATESAIRIRNAVLRLPGDAGPDIALMQAELDLAGNDPVAAEARLNELLAHPGPETARALVDLVDARTSQALPVPPDLVPALEGVVQEFGDSPEAVGARQALVWAKAASGDFDGAFADLPAVATAEQRLWQLLARLGTDDALLRHAVLAADGPRPSAEAVTGAVLAQRLSDLGMADAALRWAEDFAAEDALLIAQLHLQRHDGRAALTALSLVPADAGNALRADALGELGEYGAAALLFAQAGDGEAEVAAMARAGDWPGLAQRGAEPWKTTAALLPPEVPPAGEGPLARADRVAQASTDTRAEVTLLLAAVAAD